MPKAMPVASDTRAAKASTPPSSAICPVRGVKRPANATSRSSDSQARRTPSAPPASATSTLSVTSWRSRRPRLEPSAVRTAISRLRRSVRESARFATLADAMISTSSVTPTSTASAERAPSTSCSPRSAASPVMPSARAAS